MKFLRQTSHQLYQQHLLQQLPKFLEAPHEIFANGHDSTNGSGIGISIVDFLVALSRLGQGNGLLASTPKGGWIPGPEKLVPKRWRIFFWISFCCFLGLGFVLRRNKGSKSSKQTKNPSVFFVWSLL